MALKEINVSEINDKPNDKIPICFKVGNDVKYVTIFEALFIAETIISQLKLRNLK